uniref:Major facilitator superfamily (MFS) profile domain-containing protein n=1 Tax=Mola mola TaxID=94237 RepID=A0A3Q3XNE3_MOLML
MTDYEESVAFLGTWGPFQRRVLFLLCLIAVPSGYNILSVIFLLATPPHHCYIPTESNLSQEWIEASIPVQQVAGLPERSSCSRYELDLVQNLSALGTRSGLGLKQEGCKDGWTYSTEHFQSTVVTEFNLVCGDQWKQPLSSLVYFLGGLSGCLASGPISDRFGRKPVLFGAIVILSTFTCAVAFAPSWPVSTVIFFMMGLGQIASYIVVFVLGSEILTGRTRVFYSNLCLPFAYVFGMMMLPCSAYLVGHWRHLSLIMAVPGLASIPLCWLIPESSRWLVSRGRLQEAELRLRSAALENRVKAPDVIFRLTTVRNSNLTLCCSHLVFRFSLNMSYFGMQFNMTGLSGNPFLNYVLVSGVEFLAFAASWLVVRSFPRRPSFICFTLLGSLALLLIQITLSHPAITLSLVMLGKFGILAGISVLYIFTGELSPTVIRNTALSSCASFSRVGCCVSPYLLQLVVISQYLPWIIVGSLSLLSGFICFFLPETFRQPLPDTIQQMRRVQRSVCGATSHSLCAMGRLFCVSTSRFGLFLLQQATITRVFSWWPSRRR